MTSAWTRRMRAAQAAARPSPLDRLTERLAGAMWDAHEVVDPSLSPTQEHDGTWHGCGPRWWSDVAGTQTYRASQRDQRYEAHLVLKLLLPPWLYRLLRGRPRP